ncbi:MAG: zinc-dependent alcohol dehydrogenase family protein [Alphaproteobacteria bacterium]|nr:zinc-dependent alcohol dehydrogenase family protein [Alphaproteobacteria bacterium]
MSEVRPSRSVSRIWFECNHTTVCLVLRVCCFADEQGRRKVKVVQFQSYGGPEVLEVVERPSPEPGPGEIRIRAEAIGVGVPDILMRRGTYSWIPPFPVVPGNEMAGVVDAVGAGVEYPRVGDRVYMNARELPDRGGGYAEEVVVPAEAVFALPEEVSAEHAVSLGNYQLAWLLLNFAASPAPGGRILVHAAAGGVGGAVVQMARSVNLEVYGIAGSPEKAAYVESLGADAVIDRSSENIRERVADLSDGQGVDVVYDSVGGENFTDGFRMLAPMGTVVLFGYLGGWPDPNVLEPMRDRLGRSLALRLFSIHVLDDWPDMRRRAMEEAIAAMETGSVVPDIHSSLPLDAAADAHRLLEAGSVTGKVVLTP